MNCINLESPGKCLSGRGSLRSIPIDLGSFYVPCGSSPGRIAKADRPARPSLAKRSRIGNQNRNGSRMANSGKDWGWTGLR